MREIEAMGLGVWQVTVALVADALRARAWPTAALLALGMTRYWRAVDGLRLDVGTYVAGLEYATGRSAVVVGKPATAFFSSALELLGCIAEEAVMVGDDIVGDVGGAQSAGLGGVLVRTGKFRPADLDRDDIKPDAVFASFADVPAWIESHCG